MQNPPFEDASPIKNGDFPASHVSFWWCISGISPFKLMNPSLWNSEPELPTEAVSHGDPRWPAVARRSRRCVRRPRWVRHHDRQRVPMSTRGCRNFPTWVVILLQCHLVWGVFEIWSLLVYACLIIFEVIWNLLVGVSLGGMMWWRGFWMKIRWWDITLCPTFKLGTSSQIHRRFGEKQHMRS